MILTMKVITIGIVFIIHAVEVSLLPASSLLLFLSVLFVNLPAPPSLVPPAITVIIHFFHYVFLIA